MTDENLFLKLVGLNIKKERQVNNLTIREMAGMMGLSEQTIVSIENGTRGTKLENYNRISIILDMSLDDMVGKSDIVKLSEPGKRNTSKKDKLNAMCRSLTEEQAGIVVNFIDQLLGYTKEISNTPERIDTKKGLE